MRRFTSTVTLRPLAGKSRPSTTTFTQLFSGVVVGASDAANVHVLRGAVPVYGERDVEAPADLRAEGGA